MPENVSVADVKAVLTQYQNLYCQEDDSSVWFGKITDLATALGFAAKPKEYKTNPDAYKGHVGDISMIIRIAVTGKAASPDLYSVMQILGKETVISRLQKCLESLD